MGNLRQKNRSAVKEQHKVQDSHILVVRFTASILSYLCYHIVFPTCSPHIWRHTFCHRTDSFIIVFSLVLSIFFDSLNLFCLIENIEESIPCNDFATLFKSVKFCIHSNELGGLVFFHGLHGWWWFSNVEFSWMSTMTNFFRECELPNNVQS